MDEEEKQKIADQINKEIYEELGNFGEIVERSREFILKGYARPKGLESPPRELEIIELPEIEELIEYDNTFEESNLERWNRYRQMYQNATKKATPIKMVAIPAKREDRHKVKPAANQSPRKQSKP